MRNITTIVVATLAVLLSTTAASATDDERTFVRDTADGSFVDHERRVADPFTPMVTPPPLRAGVGGVVWTRHVTDAIYTSTGLTMPSARLIAGTWLNPPIETQVAPLDGDGTLDWTYPGARCEVAASRDADVVAAVDFESAPQRVTVHKWTVDSAVPDWSVEIEPVTLASYRTLRVSADGSKIAVLVTDQSVAPIRAQLHVFDAETGVPSVIDADPNTFARNLAIGDDGKYVAFIAAATIYVVDTSTGTYRFTGSAGATNDPIGISTDGSILAYGWTSLIVRQWDGATYASLFLRGGGGRTLRQCIADADGSTLVATWSAASSLQNRVEIFDLPSSVPLWTYDYLLGSGALQDIPRDAAMTPDGSHFAVASWGDAGNTNPEVHVFSRAAGAVPVLTVDTPGSMFGVDLARGPGGVLRVAAAGKHIHANMSGRGGDLYSIILPTDCTADVDGDGAVAFSDILAILAAWGPYDPCPPFAPADINEDCEVAFSDLLLVLGAWGPCD